MSSRLKGCRGSKGGRFTGLRGRRGVAAAGPNDDKIFLFGEGERRRGSPRSSDTRLMAGWAVGRVVGRWLGLAREMATTLERRRRVNCSVPSDTMFYNI